MTTEWEIKYPMVTVHALDRGVSDHTPLLLDTSDPSFLGQQNSSKWNLVGYLMRIWNRPVRGENAVRRWNRKLGALRKHLRGWARHHHGVYKA